MDYNLKGEIFINNKYKCFRLTSNSNEYMQDCILAMAYYKCDLVVHKLQNVFLNNVLSFSHTQFKHRIIAECDAITNIKVTFPFNTPSNLSIELQQFSRMKRHTQKVEFDIITKNEILLRLPNPINIVFYNHGSYLQFNTNESLDNNMIDRIMLEFDVIFMNTNIRNTFILDTEQQLLIKN